MRVELEELVAGAVDQGVYELLRQRLIKVVPVAAPLAGAEWTQAVPAGVSWDLIGLRCRLVTSAVVANRQPSFVCSDSAGVQFARFGIANALAASSSGSVDLWQGLGSPSGSGPLMGCLPSPPIVAPAGSAIASVTNALDVGDQYSQVALIVREWSIEGVLNAAEWFGRHTR